MATHKQQHGNREGKELQKEREHDRRSGQAVATTERILRARKRGVATTPPRDRYKARRD